MDGFGGGRVNYSQNKSESDKQAKKSFTSRGEKKGKKVMLIMCARQTLRARETENNTSLA